MPQFTKPEAWTTAGGLFLEGNADLVVKGDKNYLVTAGPGAGKTELLAQKACYLLETNTCKSPKKILAISFKRDAASIIAIDKSLLAKHLAKVNPTMPPPTMVISKDCIMIISLC